MPMLATTAFKLIINIRTELQSNYSYFTMTFSKNSLRRGGGRAARPHPAAKSRFVRKDPVLDSYFDQNEKAVNFPFLPFHYINDT